MGYHYIPQKYLREFQDAASPGQVWLYDKLTGESRLASIKKVAQSAGFYEPVDEKRLASLEKLANEVLRRLQMRQSIDDRARKVFSVYMGTMIKRVPFHRQQSFELIPQVAEREMDRFRQAVDELGASPEVKERLVGRVEAQMSNLLDDPIPEILALISEPWVSLRVINAIYSMTWRVLEAKGPTYFISSDNPAFFFRGLGLARKDSELVFPLCSTHALHCCWQPAQSELVFLSVREQFVKEINRRVASTTTRLAFYHQQVDWLLPLLRKPQHALNAIRW